MGASALARSSGAHLTWPDCKHLPCPSDGRSSTFPIPPNFAKTFPYCRRGMPAACAAALRTATHAGREGGLLQRKANQDACLAAVGFKGHAAQSLFGVFDGHGPVGVPAEWMCVSIARAVHAGIQAHITSQNTGLRQERPTCMYGSSLQNKHETAPSCQCLAHKCGASSVLNYSAMFGGGTANR